MSKCQAPNKKKDISLVPDQHAYCQKNQGSCVSQPTAPTSAFNLYFPSRPPICIYWSRPSICFYQAWHSICVCLFFDLQLKFVSDSVYLYMYYICLCTCFLSKLLEISKLQLFEISSKEIFSIFLIGFN